MRIYSASGEETLRARKLLKEWASDGVLSEVQQQRLEQETISELRTTNIFLRLVLFFFSMIIVGAAVGLFFVVFLSRSSEQAFGASLLIFAAVCYAAAEVVVSRFRLYHHGIEEALVVCSVGFLCVGIWAAFFSSHNSDGARFLVPAVGAVASLWIWRRFGHWYAFVAAMFFVLFPAGYFASSQSAQRVIIAVIYAIGLICIAAIRSGHRNDYLDEGYSLAEALLWLGIYLSFNLKLSSLDLPSQWWSGGNGGVTSEFGRPFYWTTWVLIWCLPPMVLARGIRQKDRFIIGVGAVIAILTFVSNKPYLGWPRHTWDPMLLGIFLTGVAIFLRRWIAAGPGGVRHGFTAERLSGKDKNWMSTGSAVLGLMTPQAITPRHASSPEFKFGGGTSGGGGASSEF